MNKLESLKSRLAEINASNETAAIAILRTQLAIKRLRLEYAILLERLEAKTDQAQLSEPPKKKTKFKAKPKERDPNLPKRPTNSYLIFCEMEKDNIKQRLEAENPPGTVYDMSKVLTETWKGLSEEDKKPYVKLYEDDRERYSREIKAYNESKKPPSQAQLQTTFQVKGQDKKEVKRMSLDKLVTE